MHRILLGLACVAAVGLTACGGGGDDDPAPASSGSGSSGAGSGTAGTLAFTGTNNSARTGFTPPTDGSTCIGTKAAFIQINCLKPGSPAGTTENLMITYAGAMTAGTVVNLTAGGSTLASFTTTELAGTALTTRFWGSEAVGSITLTAISATSVTFKLTGVSLKADTLSGGSASTGTILADGTVTIALR